MLVAALSDGLNLSHLVEHLSSLIGCSVEHRRIKLVSESKHLAVCKILSHHCDACLIGWIWCSMIPFRASVHIWQKVVKSKPKTCTIILKIAQFLHFHSHTYTYVYVVYIYNTALIQLPCSISSASLFVCLKHRKPEVKHTCFLFTPQLHPVLICDSILS